MQSEPVLLPERRRVVPLCDKVAGRFFAASVMKFLSLARRDVLKTGRSFVASTDGRNGRERRERAGGGGRRGEGKED
jgi:hypothetical protein